MPYLNLRSHRLFRNIQIEQRSNYGHRDGWALFMSRAKTDA